MTLVQASLRLLALRKVGTKSVTNGCIGVQIYRGFISVGKKGAIAKYWGKKQEGQVGIIIGANITGVAIVFRVQPPFPNANPCNIHAHLRFFFYLCGYRSGSL